MSACSAPPAGRWRAYLPTPHHGQGRRGTTADALYKARRTLLTRDSLLTERQQTRLAGLFADQRHTIVEVTWCAYQKTIDAYQHPDKAHSRGLMSALVTSIATGVPASLDEIARPAEP